MSRPEAKRWICLSHRFAWHGLQACPVGDVQCLVVEAIGGADKRRWYEMKLLQRSEADYLALCELSLAARSRDSRLPLLARAVTRIGRSLRLVTVHR